MITSERAAHDLLAPVYGWFTEGFDTRDLQDAKALLEELDELENAPALGRCSRCGGEIRGTQRKRYCSSADNAHCFRARRAAAKLDERRRRR
jgi:hypothetical protein